MWSRNLLIASVVVFLATTISTAPVEGMEVNEWPDVFLSASGNGGGGGGGGGAGGGGGGDSHTSPSDPSSHDASLSGHAGSSSDTSIAGQITYYKCSMGQAGGSSTLIIIHEAHPQPAGIIHYINETEIESPEYDTPESPEFNGNGHKLLIGGAVENGHAAIPVVTDLFIEDTTHMDPTGAMDPLGASSHLDNTGIIDQSSHDFLIGLMGGVGDPYASDIHIDISDHTGMTSQLDSIAVGSGPEPALSSSSSPGPDVPPGLGDHIGLISDFTGLTDYSGPDHPYLSSGFHGSYHSAGDHAGLSDTTDHPVAVMSHTDYSSSHVDHPGNGRQSQVTDTHGGDHAVNDVHHDVTDPSGQQIVSTDIGLVDAAITDGVAVQHHDDVHTVSPQADTTALGDNVYSSSAPGTPGRLRTCLMIKHSFSHLHIFRADRLLAAASLVTPT
uniref:Uncharacterized protein n=1 Tax=Salmo trutta TaxID=8032 RepID=A0A674EHF4_SALTR